MFSNRSVKSAIKTAWDELDEDVVGAVVARVPMHGHHVNKSGHKLIRQKCDILARILSGVFVQRFMSHPD